MGYHQPREALFQEVIEQAIAEGMIEEVANDVFQLTEKGAQTQKR